MKKIIIKGDIVDIDNVSYISFNDEQKLITFCRPGGKYGKFYYTFDDNDKYLFFKNKLKSYAIVDLDEEYDNGRDEVEEIDID